MASLRPLGGTPAPTLTEGFRFGEPTGPAIDDHERQWRADAVINGGSKYRFDGSLT